MNSSFSPPPSRICRLQSDGFRHSSNGATRHGSSLSSLSKGSRSRVGSDRYANHHHHSVSDGVLSYSDSTPPPHNFQGPRWTSPVPKFKFGEFATTSSLEGSRSDTWFPHSTERRYRSRAITASPSFASPSSLPESGRWDSTRKQPFSLPSCNISGRLSFKSKAVYPLVFRNPVSDYETFGDADITSVGRLTPGEDWISPSLCRDDSSSSVEHNFHKTLSELRKFDTSPDEPSASSQREGFRWSSASSYDLGFDGESIDIDTESLKSPHKPVGDQKCGICGKLLCQKSPWSSHRIMRGSDMPVSGVLSCSHVFHAECLEQMTPKSQIHDPPCPLCLKMVRGGEEESSSMSEPMQMALRSARRSGMGFASKLLGNHSNNDTSHRFKDRLRRSLPQWNQNGSSIKNHLKRQWIFKGKAGKEFFSSKFFHRTESSGKEPICRRLSIR